MGALIDQLGFFQLILDVGLLVCLLFLIIWMRKTPVRIEGRRMLESTEDFLAASERLNSEFEKNLNRKQALINELMSGLDQRTTEIRRLLGEAGTVLARLEKATSAPPDRLEPGLHFTPQTEKTPPLTEKEKDVLVLFRKGLPVARIASRLRMPKGEVELILGLHRRA